MSIGFPHAPLNYRSWKETGVSKPFEANSDLRVELANRLELQSLKQLNGSWQGAFIPKFGLVYVSGELTAKVVQNCVVSNEAVETALDGPFSFPFLLDAAEDKAPHKHRKQTYHTASREGLQSDNEEAEPMPPEGLDLAELLFQELLLLVPPYPRKADLPEFVYPQEQNPSDDRRQRPFANLKAQMNASE